MDRRPIGSIETANGSHPRLEILFGLPEQVFQLAFGPNVAGSSGKASIQLRHPSVSPEHCRITRTDSQCWVEDLGSRNGTFVNGSQIRKKSSFTEGDVLFLGSVRLRYGVGDIPAKAPESRAGSIMTVKGKPASEIPLSGGSMTIGRDAGCDVVLPSSEISPLHARIEGVRVMAASASEDCRANGHHFDEHQLAYGDQIQLGPFHFRYDGSRLLISEGDSGAMLVARDLSVIADGRRILDRVSLAIEPNKFVGVIGPVGAGKSTFLRALNGLTPATSGRVLINGGDLYEDFGQLGSEFGWVPQESIVHQELTVAEALDFAARLRLPREVPRRELPRLVEKTAARLELTESLGVPVGRLSGGQRKKVSVGVELLSRPHVLVLDEPTSGLDPGGEFHLMESLRHLADSGCTVICSTHVMQNLYMLDLMAVLSDGMLVFLGKPEEAKAFFGVRETGSIFGRLTERSATEWREVFESTRPPEPQPLPARVAASRRNSRSIQFPLLFERQWAILSSDWRNGFILLSQPVLIGALLAWAVQGTLDDSSLKLFFAFIAALWFGCSNGAQAIVGELPIYRRERTVGLRRNAYLFSKWVFISLITVLQVGLLYGIARFAGAGIDGDPAWQCGGLAAIAGLASCIGLAISAISRSSMQAVLLTPLVIIPQIILSGYTVPAAAMKPLVSAVSEAIPAFQIQRIMDTSLLWGKAADAQTLEAHMQAFQNINTVLHLKTGGIVCDPVPAGISLAIEAAWLLAAYIFCLVVLRIREREL